jgi:hypothetical protein
MDGSEEAMTMLTVLVHPEAGDVLRKRQIGTVRNPLLLSQKSKKRNFGPENFSFEPSFLDCVFAKKWLFSEGQKAGCFKMKQFFCSRGAAVRKPNPFQELRAR